MVELRIDVAFGFRSGIPIAAGDAISKPDRADRSIAIFGQVANRCIDYFRVGDGPNAGRPNQHVIAGHSSDDFVFSGCSPLSMDACTSKSIR